MRLEFAHGCLALALWTGATGCGARHPSPEGAGVIKTLGMDRSATVRGTAENAKAGAVIVTADDGPVYVFGLEAWPEKVVKKEVSATGFLKHEKLIPSPVVGSNGEQSAGADGEQSVLHDARWGLVQPESWKRGIGTATTVRGEARNTKWGAVILTPEGPCYVNGLREWPPDIVNKPVSATGDVQRNKRPTGPDHDDSAIGGQPGEEWALGDPRWSSP